MPFIAPLALLGLAFVPLVVAFWMLRLRRTERVVSSTLLWKRFGEDLEANAPWQRLRRSLLLLLQLLLVVILALLAARPYFERPATLARDLVIVVDASASMAATDVAPSRIAVAKQAALDALRDLPSGGKVSVIAAGATSRVVANATSDLGRVRQAISSIEAAPAAGDLADALRLASALAARSGDAEVVVATDAAFTPPAGLRVDAPVRVLPVGTARRNQAIVALAVRTAPSAVTRSVFASVANLDLSPVTTRVEIWGDGRLLEARELFLDPVSRADVGIDDVPRDVSVIEVRLGGGDQLAYDDRAWAIVPPDRLLRILLVSNGDPYLETALAYLPNAELYGVTPADYGTKTKPELFDLVIFDANVPAELPHVPTLLVAPPRSSPLATVSGTLKDPAVGRTSPDEPLLRYVDLTTLHVAEAVKVTLPDWARTVIPGPAGSPLLYLGERDGLRAGVLAFEPRRSDLPLQVAFPILVSNVVGELVGASQAPTSAVAPGSLVNLPVPAGATGLRVTRPDGSTVEIAPAVTGGAAATFAGTEQLGVYTVEAVGRPAATPAPSAGGSGTAGPTPAASATPGSPAPGGSPTPAPLVNPDAPVRFAVDLFDIDEFHHRPGRRSPDHRARDHEGGRWRWRRDDRPPARPRGAVDPDRPARPRAAPRRVDPLRARRDRPAPAVVGEPPRGGGIVSAGWPIARRRLGRSKGQLMGISFAEPVALLLWPLLFGLAVLLHLAARRRLGDLRTRLALAVRGLLLAALVLALSGVSVVLPVDRLATVFVVDLSDSVGNAGRADALAFVREALAERPPGDLAGIVAFGKDALVERLPTELEDIDRLASTPVKSATDVGAALRLAAALFPDDAQKRIVLVSDGNDTTGSGGVEAARAGTRGIQVETRAIGLGALDEVLVDRVTAPTLARLGEEIEVSAEIRSTADQPATVRLFADGVPVATERPQLAVGLTTVTFRIKPAEVGFHVFRVVVEAARDTFSQNNRSDASTIVTGEPRVLVVAGDESVAADLVTALRTEKGQAETVMPEQMPDDPARLSGYDSVVLVDAARARFSDRQLEALRTTVRDFGKGLVMIGGEQSYGAGGFRNTPLEEALPVEMVVKDKEKQPDIALIVVIDESGSMDACHCNSFDRSQGVQLQGVRKVDIGKEAILRAAAAMAGTDELGVVAFNEAAHWVVRRQPMASVTDLQGSLGAIQPEGQTNIYAGLDQAVTALEGAAASRRHIILLTDGWSSSGQYDAILARMKAAGITLSTVGAGGGANPILKDLATRGGGRFYAAANPATIPDIFLKETEQVAGRQIVEEKFFPIQQASSPILRGLDAGLPALLGYNGTTAKSAASTVLVSSRSDPVLAQWQYGLGRAVAWTSDATGRWAKNWVGWDGFTRFFSQLVAWTYPGEESGGIEARFVQTTGATILRVESVGPDGTPRDFYATTVSLVDPALESRLVELPQVAPGVYEAPVGELLPGAYTLRVTQTRSGAAAVGRTLGLVAPTPAEYRLLGLNEPLLAAIRNATGGRAVTTAAQAWTHDLGTTTRATDLWPLLLLLALLLWPLDVFLRRVALTRRDLAAARAWMRGLPARRRRVAARTAPVEGLLAATERAGGAAAREAIVRSRRDEVGPARGGGDILARPASGSADPADPAAPAAPRAGPGPAAPATPALPAPPRSTVPFAPSGPAAAPNAPSAVPGAPAADTLERLRDAKRRARR